MAKKKSIAATPIESTKHRDSRKNIPTEELRDFVEEQEQKPVTVLYPRDPSLDPQLVWKGKDEQDSKDWPLATHHSPNPLSSKISTASPISTKRWTFIATISTGPIE